MWSLNIKNKHEVKLMNTKFIAFAIVVSSLVLAASAFEPAFKLVQPEGKIKIKTEESKRPTTPKVDQAYAYGSVIKLAKGASVTVLLGDGSSVKLIGPATVTMSEKGKEKIIDLDGGKAEFNLASDFNKNKQKLTVKSKDNEISPVTGGEFSVNTSSSYSFNNAGVIADSAQVNITGAQYEINSFGPKSELNISTANDGSFSKIAVPNGNMNITFNTDKGEQKVKVEKGETVNIWRNISAIGKSVASTVMITGPDSTVKSQFSFTKELQIQKMDLFVASTTTTTTTTTTTSTTTTVSPTPVGDR